MSAPRLIRIRRLHCAPGAYQRTFWNGRPRRGAYAHPSRRRHQARRQIPHRKVPARQVHVQDGLSARNIKPVQGRIVVRLNACTRDISNKRRCYSELSSSAMASRSACAVSTRWTALTRSKYTGQSSEMHVMSRSAVTVHFWQICVITSSKVASLRLGLVSPAHLYDAPKRSDSQHTWSSWCCRCSASFRRLYTLYTVCCGCARHSMQSTGGASTFTQNATRRYLGSQAACTTFLAVPPCVSASHRRQCREG